MKGSIDYLGEDRFAVLMVSNGGHGERAVTRADELVSLYGMQGHPRVRLGWDEGNLELLSQLGQFVWGYIVIGADGKLAGINLHNWELGAVLSAATGRSDSDSEFRVATETEGPEGYGFAHLTKDVRSASLAITLTLPEGWHIYGRGEENPVPTEVNVAYTGGLTFGDPVIPEGEPGTGGTTRIDGPVEIRVPVEVPSGLPVGEYLVHGSLRSMACNEERCLPAMELPWSATFSVH